MRIYFVRHGKSLLNESGTHQFPHTNLSETGKQQAEFVAKRLQTIDFETVIASDLARAKETAEIIHVTTGKPIVFTELARERYYPSELHGQRMDDPNIKAIHAVIEKNIRDPHYHFSDEENFFDLKDRAKRLLNYLTERDEQSLVVVLHGTILRYVMMTMAYGDNYDWDTYIGMAMFFYLHNTGITVCEQRDDRWKLMTWNDYAHLGEVK